MTSYIADTLPALGWLVNACCSGSSLNGKAYTQEGKSENGNGKLDIGRPSPSRAQIQISRFSLSCYVGGGHKGR